MFNKFVFLTTICSSLAFANAASNYAVVVTKIDPLETEVGGDIIKFSGDEASDFMKLLPPVVTERPYADVTAKHQRSLSVTTKKLILTFYCEDAEIDSDGDQVSAKPLGSGANCTIRLNKNDASVAPHLINFAKDGGANAVIKQLQIRSR